MYAKIENETTTIYNALPNKYVSENINCAGGFNLLDEAIHKAEGFYPIQIPAYNVNTQKLSTLYFDAANELFTYDVLELSELELTLLDWHHQEYSKRIVAPSSLIDEYPNIAIWMQLNQLPIVLSEDTLTCYLYMNIVKPQHQSLVDSLQGIVTIEDLPV